MSYLYAVICLVKAENQIEIVNNQNFKAMPRVSTAKNYPKISVSGSSAKLNAKRPNSQKPESVRDILVPCYNPGNCTTLWKKSDLRRVKTASRIVSKEERQRQIEKIEAERKQQEWESQSRKQFLQEIDKARDERMGKNQDPFAEEKAEKNAEILNRVLLAKFEQVFVVTS